jgi:hypothetical protein
MSRISLATPQVFSFTYILADARTPPVSRVGNTSKFQLFLLNPFLKCARNIRRES